MDFSLRKAFLVVAGAVTMTLATSFDANAQNYEKTKIETLNRHITIDAKHQLNTMHKDTSTADANLYAAEPWRADPAFHRDLKKFQEAKYNAYYSAVSVAEAGHNRIQQRAKDNLQRGLEGVINADKGRTQRDRTNNQIKNGGRVLTEAEKIRLEHEKINNILDVALNRADEKYNNEVYNVIKRVYEKKYADQIVRPMSDKQFEQTKTNIEKTVDQQNQLNQIKAKQSKPVRMNGQ